MRFERDGIALEYRDEGRGEPVVLLHGHTLDLRVWDELAAALALAGFRTIRYDQRGHGRSTSPPAGYRFGDHAADLAALLAHLDAAPAHVVGLSLGGGIALEAALRHPAVVRSLVLVAPRVPDFPISPELHESFRRVARAIRADGVERAMREEWLPHPLMASAHAAAGARERVEAMVLAFPAGEYLAAARNGADREWLVIDRLDEIAADVLVVSGEHDVPDFKAMAALVAERVPGCVLEVVSGCGHLVPLEAPEALAAAVLGFLRGVRAAAGAGIA